MHSHGKRRASEKSVEFTQRKTGQNERDATYEGCSRKSSWGSDRNTRSRSDEFTGPVTWPEIAWQENETSFFLSLSLPPSFFLFFFFLFLVRLDERSALIKGERSRIAILSPVPSKKNRVISATQLVTSATLLSISRII